MGGGLLERQSEAIFRALKTVGFIQQRLVLLMELAGDEDAPGFEILRASLQNDR